MVRFFDDSIYTGKINIDEAEIGQGSSLKNILEFNNKSRSKIKGGKEQKKTSDSVSALSEG